MVVLFRILTVAFVIWLICRLFYSLGKRSAIEDFKRHKKEDTNEHSNRKVVESSVVEKENHIDGDDDKC